MKFDLPTARIRIGLQATDTSRDEELKSAIDFALAVAEQYCDRRFLWKVEESTFYYTSASGYNLTRYPVSRIRSLTLGDNKSGIGSNRYKMHYAHGILLLDKALVSRQISIVYEGGYQDLPADLVIALWGIFDVIWAQMQGGAAVAAGEIDSITIPDVGTVRFNNKTADSSAGSSSNTIYGINFNLLDKYRRVEC